eukprot:366431-Chlamydomonas_euryale.AAC.8
MPLTAVRLHPCSCCCEQTQPGATAEDINKLSAGGSVMVSPAQGKGFPVDKIPSGQFDTVLMVRVEWA